MELAFAWSCVLVVMCLVLTNLEILDTSHDPKSIDVTVPEFEFHAPSDE